ncbi:radical SAM/SPASM domain-containing protein [Clostridium lacusfryxellense]|uniref:radical SAM/SPASM domain-containing protein n=1 Tax=Clostridium lacusfryxellense TaxID=205328 RepID=UPI001C0E850B|nr:radical SAM protein [Clostridium lacusfryxellense]MBU3110231.1 radical SAM protein [Clostridium lacusfryxellense]
MILKENFHENILQFEVDGIHMIGNSATGVFLGLDEQGRHLVSKIIEKSDSIDISQNDEDLINAMHRNSFFKKEENVPPYISSAYVHVTDKCNLHCVGCYSYVDDRNIKIDLTFEELCEIFDKLNEVNIKQVVISGGEPFIREDFSNVCKYAHSLGISLMVISNGTMPLEAYAEALPYIKAISISVDSYDKNISFIRDRGIMPKVIETIEFLRDKIPTKMIITLHKKNAMHMKEYAKLSKILNVPFNFSVLTVDINNLIFKDYLLDDNDFKLMSEYLEDQKDIVIQDSPMDGFSLQCKTRCEAGRHLISIGADGSVYPCHMLHKDELKLGNILNQNLKDIVFTKKNPFLNISVDQIEGCTDCKYKYFCGGNCRARSYLSTHSIYENDNLCEVSYSHIESKFENLKKMYKLNV